MKKLNILLMGIFLILITLPVIAREIDNLSLSPTDIKVGNPVEITIDFKINDDDSTNNQSASSFLGAGTSTNSQAKVNLPCAVKVDFGDGQSEHTRVEGDNPSFKIIHNYKTAGSYTLTAEGKTMVRSFKSVFGCSGNVQTLTANVLSEDIVSKQEEINHQNVTNNSTQIAKIETKGLSTKVLFKKGTDAYIARQYEDAETLISAGLKAKPRDANGNLYLGLTLKELNQKDRATNALKVAMKGKLSKDNRQLAKQALADIKVASNKSITEVANSSTIKSTSTVENSKDSTTVKAEVIEEHWIRDSNGCKAAPLFKLSSGSFTWSGNCKNGFIDGYGIIKYIPDNSSYEGNVTNGYRNGKGVFIDNYNRYEGNYVNNIRNGKGVKISKINGMYYEQEYVNDELVASTTHNPDGSIESVMVGNRIDYYRDGKIVDTLVDGKRVATVALAGNTSNTKTSSSQSNTYSAPSEPDPLFDIISGVTGIVAQNKINHDAKRQRQAVAQQQAQQLADQQAQAEQQAYDNSRAQLDAQRAREIQANTESMNSFHAGTATNSTLASNNNTRNAANNSSSNSARTSTPARKPPQAPCTSTSTYNDRKGIPSSETFVRGNTIFIKVLPNTSYGADCTITYNLNGNRNTLWLNNIPGNQYSEGLVGNYAESMEWKLDNLWAECGLSQFERDRRETKRKQEIMHCEFERR